MYIRLSLLLLCFSSTLHATTVYVASSFSHPLQLAAEAVSQQLTIVSGSSSSLARQLTRGAESDLFISANTMWADYVISYDHIAPAPHKLTELTSQLLVMNQLALVRSPSLKEGSYIFRDVIQGIHGRVAVGNPTHVPAGIYTNQAREALNLSETSAWVPARSVKQALRFVETNATPFGVVYKTDALHSTQTVLVEVIDENLHDPIEYTAVALTAKGETLIQLLTTEPSIRVLQDYGFLIP